MKYDLVLSDLLESEVEMFRRECPEYLEAMEIQEELATMDDPPRLRRIVDGLIAFNHRTSGEMPPINEWLNDIKTNPNYRDNRVGKEGMLRYAFLEMYMPDELDELIETGRVESHLNKIDLACELAQTEEQARMFVTKQNLDDPVWTEWMKERFEERGYETFPYKIKKLEPYPNFRLTVYGEAELEKLRDDPATLRAWIREGELSAHLMTVQDQMYEREKMWTARYLESHKDEMPLKDSPEFKGWMNTVSMMAEEAVLNEAYEDDYDEELVELCEEFFC
ncbi:MAG: TnpV protein [Pyramidobacter sp.]|nr:TnpV protein [Pyramidobacter sp.]